VLNRHEWDAQDAVGLADLIRKREVTPREVIETAIARIEELNPILNAVIYRAFDQALTELSSLPENGAFSGVPYLLKDLHAPARGMPLTSGSRLFADNVPDFDSSLVTRLRAAGFVLLGRTNSPEFGLSISTEPQAFGPTRNPWNLERIAGGSSGGSAAAVAGGMLPAAHATDSGGSIRIPASCNGLVGLKPTRGLTPFGPHRGDANHGISHEHAVSRTVRDTAAILDMTAGPDVGAPYFAPRPAQGFSQALQASLRPLRVAFTTQTFTGAGVDEECAAGVKGIAELLAEMGHRVDEAAPEFDCAALQRDVFTMLFGNLAATVGAWERAQCEPAREDQLEPLSRAAIERGRAMSLDAYLAALAGINREVRRIARFFEEYDVLLTPTLAAPPPRLGFLSTNETDVDAYLDRLFGFAPFTVPFNATGQPAISLPLHWTRDGLPVGIQLVGRYGEDADLLCLAARLEEARPFRRPSM